MVLSRFTEWEWKTVLLQKRILCVFLMGVYWLISMINVAQAMQKAISLRGVVEGFYGTPWTHEQRLDQLKFYGQEGLNIYIYAPKDDPYHREKWREKYPLQEMMRMSEIIQTAKANHVEFVFALSPGLDMRTDSVGYADDMEAILRKFTALYDLGVRQFAVFFDDIENKDGVRQALLLNEVNRRFIHEHEDVKPLITVPTEYYTEDMLHGGTIKTYTRDFAGTLDKDILVLYTGKGVVCEGISPEELEKVESIYGREMLVWWNYPVSDYRTGKLALGPITGIPAETGAKMGGFIINPMEYAVLSKIAVATGAAYAADPAGYDAEASWEKAIAEQYGSLADDMMIFAEHSQRMENSWAHVGRPDGVHVRKHMDMLWQMLDKGEDISFVLSLLHHDFSRIEKAVEHLEKDLPAETKVECAPQLRRLQQLAEADEIAIRMIEAKLNKQSFLYRRFYGELLQADKVVTADERALISEKTLRAFIDEALAWQAKQEKR